MRIALVLSTLSLLLACQSGPPAAPRTATLVLNRPLPVGAERTAVEVQAGEVHDGSGIDRYRPYCRFELARLADTARQIAPGRYPILRQYETVPAARAPQALRYASLMSVSDDPSYYVFATVFELASNTAALARLTCQHWELPAPNLPRHLTADEMRAALGAIAQLE